MLMNGIGHCLAHVLAEAHLFMSSALGVQLYGLLVLFAYSTYFNTAGLPFDNLQESLTSAQTSFLILSSRFLLFNMLWYMVYRVQFQIQKHHFYFGAHIFFSCDMIMRLWFYSVCCEYQLSHYVSHNLFLKYYWYKEVLL